MRCIRCVNQGRYRCFMRNIFFTILNSIKYPMIKCRWKMYQTLSRL